MNNKKAPSQKMKNEKKQKKQPILMIIGIVIITIVAMVVYSSGAVKLNLSFFGTGLVIEKK